MSFAKAENFLWKILNAILYGPYLVILSIAAAEFVNDELEFGRDGRFLSYSFLLTASFNITC